MKKWIAVLGFAVSALLVFACQAETTQTFDEGKHYFVLPYAVNTSEPGKIEVAEVFRYSCPHCFEFSEQMGKWVETLADDVTFVRSPTAAGYTDLEPHVRAYYTAQALGLTEKLHHKLFAAYHQAGRLKNQREIGDVFVGAGVDRDEFDQVFSSFGIDNQCKQADSRSRGYRVTSTPCIIVNGKYRIGVASAGSQAAMLDVANYLIEKERRVAK